MSYLARDITLMKLPSISAPPNGFKPYYCYLVDVSYSPHNPVHRAILYTEHIDEKGALTSLPIIYNPNYEGHIDFSRVHYLKVIEELCSWR